MKAKMSKGEKPPEPGTYQCQRCQQRFRLKADLVCPNCGNNQQDDLTPIYREDDPEEEQFYTKKDFAEGD